LESSYNIDEVRYGLKTREEFVEHQKHSAKRKALFALEADQEAVNNQVHAEKEKKKKEKKRNKLHKKAKNLLSFGDEDEGIEASVVKNPVVDTSFLPDKEREELDMKKSLEYKKEWIAEQEIIKKQVIQVEFSYWEGVAHERCVHVLKSSTIGAFLEKGREALSKEFRELRGTNAENLIFIKEDMMIPPYVTFYDLMKANASKFSFQVQNKQSHSAKVCPRTWYELNKNAFPAINWTLYDPNIK